MQTKRVRQAVFQQSALRCYVASNHYYRDREDGDTKAQGVLSSSPLATLANIGYENTLQALRQVSPSAEGTYCLCTCVLYVWTAAVV